MRKIRYLLDTNILSEPTRETPNANVVKKLMQYPYQVAIAAPVYYELLTGYRRLPHSKRRDKLEAYLNDFISTLPILPYDENAANWHAKEQVRLSNEGLTPAFIDSQIAAIASSNHLIMITRNIDDFVCFDGIKVENWFE
jgi:tRNA(fMet)-specific endonuclease VapC